MRKGSGLLVLGVLIMGILWLSLAQNAKALSFTYSDPSINLTVSGPDLAKPGNTESYTVSGSFTAGTLYDFVNITLWLETSSQPSKVILEEVALQPGSYNLGYTFTKTFQVFIPNDAVNDRYVYSNLTTSIRQFSKISVSLVQNPTYTELQSQVTSLQSQVNSLQADKNELQSQIDSLNSNVTDLKSRNSDLNAQMNSLQSQLNDIRVQDTNATNLSLLAIGIAAVFVATTVFFALRKPKVKTT